MFELRSYRPDDAEAVWGLHDAALEDAGVHGGRGAVGGRPSPAPGLGRRIRQVAGASKSPVLVLTGPPGVGKTTVAGILASRSPRAVHLESDAFFRFVRSGYVEPWKPESHEQNSVVMGIVARAAAGYAAAGYETIVDGIVIPRWFLQPLAAVLEGAGCTVAYAVLRAPAATCIERVRSREGVPLEPGPVEQLCQSFADLGEYERNAIELDGEDPEEAADLVSRRLADGLLAI